jgi:diaminopimelate epimerase
MCGNAALCSGRLARDLEMVAATEFCLLTDAGPVRVLSESSAGTPEINLPDFEIPGDFNLVPRSKGEQWMTLLSVGVPHLVVRVDDIEVVEPESRGRSLRYDPNMGPEGANVDFVSPATIRDETWMIRTYERGVEGETLACGTGTVAAAMALATRGEATLPLRFRSRGGSELTVRGQVQSGHASEVWLGGEGQLVYRGVWEGV